MSAQPDQLDDLIASAAPPPAPRTAELQRCLTELVTDAEAAVAPARPRLARRVGMVGAAALAALTLGAGASAAGLVPAPSWAPWYDDPGAVHEQRLLASGTRCEVSYGARAVEDPAHPVSEGGREAAMAAAVAFLRDTDTSAIPVEEAVRRWRASQPSDAEGRPAPGSDDEELLAVQSELGARLRAALERQGLSPHAVGVAAAIRCDEEDGR